MELLDNLKLVIKSLYKPKNKLEEARILEISLNTVVLQKNSSDFLKQLNEYYPEFNIYQNTETSRYIVTVKA